MKSSICLGAIAIFLQVSLVAHPPVITVYPSLDDSSVEISDIVNSCEGFDRPRFEPEAACKEKLDKYFMSRPIWDDTIAFDIGNYLFSGSQEYSVLSPRYLRYGHSDKVMESLPRWRDVFDGKFLDRIEVVEKVFKIPECRELRNSEEIVVEMSETCRARELFKYSAFLDGCLTGLDRAKRWIRIDHNNRPQSYFQSSLVKLQDEFDQIQRREDVTRDDIARQFTYSTLRASWMVLQCKALVFPEFDKELNRISPTEKKLPNRIRYGLDYIVINGHDAALHIAAMAGDEWAVHRYWPDSDSATIKFWKALSDYKPLLVHGYLARYGVGQFSLDSDQAYWHAAKAFSLALEADPEMDLDLKEYVAKEFGEKRATRLMEILWEHGKDHDTLFHDESFLQSRLKYPW